MIAQDVTIGDETIIVMGTVVTKDVLPLTIVGDHESRILKYRDRKRYKSLLSQGVFFKINTKR